jgi:hypothetical protein
MPRSLRVFIPLLLLAAALPCPAQTAAAPAVQITTRQLPAAIIGTQYSFVLKASGTGPSQWQMDKGTQLPPGIILRRNSGQLIGTPLAAGTYEFSVIVTDQSNGAQAAQNFVLEVKGVLSVGWKQPPTLNSQTLSGSVQVINTSRDVFDLTVIVVAINEVGKAFALGYQHFNLAQNINQDIPFCSLLPNGHYVVHVDAVAEVPARGAIYRAQLQTPPPPIEVNVNR